MYPLSFISGSVSDVEEKSRVSNYYFTAWVLVGDLYDATKRFGNSDLCGCLETRSHDAYVMFAHHLIYASIVFT